MTLWPKLKLSLIKAFIPSCKVLNGWWLKYDTNCKTPTLWIGDLLLVNGHTLYRPVARQGTKERGRGGDCKGQQNFSLGAFPPPLAKGLTVCVKCVYSVV